MSHLPTYKLYKEMPLIFLFGGGWGAAQHRGSVRASHPASPDSNPSYAEIFSLIAAQFVDSIEIGPILCKGFRTLRRRLELSATKEINLAILLFAFKVFDTLKIYFEKQGQYNCKIAKL